MYTLCNLTFIIILIYSLIAEDIYNALVIHGLCQLEKLPESVMKVEPFWNTTGYNIGGHNFSLHDILHGVLRGEHFIATGVIFIMVNRSTCCHTV